MNESQPVSITYRKYRPDAESARYTFRYARATYASSILNVLEGNPASSLSCQNCIDGLLPDVANVLQAVQVENMLKGMALLDRMVFQERRSILSAEALLELHGRLAVFEVENAGSLRDRQVRINGCSYIPCPADEVPKRLNGLLAKLSQIADPVKRAFSSFAHISRLQAFNDCNKRTAWLSACGILLENGYAPPLFIDGSRKVFGNAMKEFYDNGSLADLQEYLQDCVDHSVKKTRSALLSARFFMLRMLNVLPKKYR